MTRFIFKAGLLAGLALSATATAQPDYDRDTDETARDQQRRDQQQREQQWRQQQQWRDQQTQNAWDRDRVYYGRFNQWGGYRMYQNRWFSLGNELTAQTNRQFLRGDDRTYDRLRIEAVRGQPYIVQIAVIYSQGNTQVIPINERLQVGAGEVLRTNGEPIRRIVVYTDPRYGGTYSVLAAQRPEYNRYRY